MSRFAVIDLGSNTFHLLIVEKIETGFEEIYRQRVYTKLSKGGSEIIQSDSFTKGIECLIEFRKKLDECKIDHYRALGTASLRTAKNGADFIALALEKANINIELIDGDNEATFIAKGVKAAIDLNEDVHLIMDIGGGSVEFIVLSKNNILWKQSFPIGLAILKSRFHKQEPISSAELASMRTYLDAQLSPLKEQLKHSPKIKTLIGASGSFEVLQAMLQLPRWNKHTYKCHVLDFFKVREMVLNKTQSERVKIKGLPAERVDLIVVAFFLMDYILKLSNTEELLISDYALKEGVISEYYDSTQV